METKNLIQKLLEFQKDCPKIVKGENNPFFKSKYAELSGIVNTIQPILYKLGIVVIQPVVGNHVVTRIVNADNQTEYIESQYPIVSKDATDPQKFGAGATYARRYALTTALGIVTEEDDDGNHAATPKKETKTESIEDEKKRLYNLCKENKIALDIDNLKALPIIEACGIMRLELTKKGVKY